MTQVPACVDWDVRPVALNNGEPCSAHDACVSGHCELSVEAPETRICCAIPCENGHGCASSGGTCPSCSGHECELDCSLAPDLCIHALNDGQSCSDDLQCASSFCGTDEEERNVCCDSSCVGKVCDRFGQCPRLSADTFPGSSGLDPTDGVDTSESIELTAQTELTDAGQSASSSDTQAEPGSTSDGSTDASSGSDPSDSSTGESVSTADTPVASEPDADSSDATSDVSDAASPSESDTTDTANTTSSDVDTSEPVSGNTAQPVDTTDVAEPTPGCGESLLSNADFDLGPQDWNASSSYFALEERAHPLVAQANDPAVSEYAGSAHSGDYFAFVGGVPNNPYDSHVVELSQDIYIPEEVTGLWLTGYVWVTGEEPLSVEYDYSVAQIDFYDSDKWFQFAQPSGSPTVWTNTDGGGDWVAFEGIMETVSEMRGQTVRFLLASRTDPGGVTNFWFDTLELRAICD